MSDVTHVVVRLPLTDEQRDAMVDAASFVAPETAHDELIRAIGTPVEASGLKTLAHVSRGGDRISLRRKQDRDIPLVRQSDAEALIAARDAKIAELTALRGTIDYLRTENARLQDTLGRMRSGSVARTVAGSNAEQPGRSRAVGEAWS